MPQEFDDWSASYWTAKRREAYIVAIMDNRYDKTIVGPDRQVSGWTWPDDSKYQAEMARR